MEDREKAAAPSLILYPQSSILYPQPTLPTADCPTAHRRPVTIPPMIRIREILDPDLRRRVLDALAERRGCSPAAIPDWFELDDLDLVDLLNDLKEQEQPEWDDDPRM